MAERAAPGAPIPPQDLRERARRGAEWKETERRRIRFYQAAARKVRSVFRVEGRALIKRVREGKLDPDPVFRATRPLWDETFLLIWRAVAGEFGATQARRLGGTVAGEPVPELKAEPEADFVFDPWPKATEEAATTFVGQKVTNVTDATKRNVQLIIRDGVRAGSTTSEIAKSLSRTYAGFQGHRSFLIARTEVVGASNFGTRQSMLQSGLDFKRTWVSSRDARVRDTHAAVDGETVPDMQTTYSNGLLFPGDPNGPVEEIANCFPGSAPLTAVGGRLKAVLRSYYRGDLVEVYCDVVPGREPLLTVTPNHPVLTSRGWVPAGVLEEGDHLLRCLSGREPVPRAKTDDDDPPPTLEQIYRSAKGAGSTQRVPGPRVNLHGHRPQGEVEIVFPHQTLRMKAIAQIPEMPPEGSLPSSDMGKVLGLRDGRGPLGIPGQGLTLKAHESSCPPSASLATSPKADTLPREVPAHRRSGESEVEGDRLDRFSPSVALGDLPRAPGVLLGVLKDLGFREWSDVDAGPPEMAKNRRGGAPVATTDLSSGDPTSIQLCEVSYLRRRYFSGHVYTLQTSGGFYVVAGVPAKNCRCSEKFDLARPLIDPAEQQREIAKSDLAHDLVEFRSPPSWAETPGVELNGVEFGPAEAEFWKNDSMTGPRNRFTDPPAPELKGKRFSAGTIILEDDGRIWFAAPKGGFGQPRAFPKGGVNLGEESWMAALRETFEETGLQTEILGHLGDYERTTSVSRYFVARRTGGQPWAFGSESEGVFLGTIDKALEAFPSGIDRQILADLQHRIALARAEFSDLAPTAGVRAYNRVIQREVGRALQRATALHVLDEKIGVEKAAVERSRMHIEQLEFLRPKGGTNPGGFYRDKITGDEWVVKKMKTDTHALNEASAARLYKLTGADAPEVRLIVLEDGRVGVASRVRPIQEIEGVLKSSPESVKGLVDGFATDAWLANWDVVGQDFDNLVLDTAKAEALRVDVGGSLLFRAMGGPKGSAFGDVVTEWDSLRTMKGNTASQVFGQIEEEKLVKGAQAVAALKDEDIAAMVLAYDFDFDQSKELINKLRTRRDDIGKRAKNILAAKTGEKTTGVLGRKFDSVGELFNETRDGVKFDDATGRLVGNRAKAEAAADRIGKLRTEELATLVGEEAAKKLAAAWDVSTGWQSNSGNTRPWAMMDAWMDSMIGKKSDEDMQRALAASYQIIQDAIGGTKTTMYRGLDWSTAFDEVVAANIQGADSVEISTRAFASWSINRSTARSFSGADTNALILKREVEAPSVIGGMGLSPGFNRRGIYATGEDELIVLADKFNDLEATGKRQSHKYLVDMKDIETFAWGPGKRYETFQEWADNNPSEIQRVIDKFGLTDVDPGLGLGGTTGPNLADLL